MLSCEIYLLPFLTRAPGLVAPGLQVSYTPQLREISRFVEVPCERVQALNARDNFGLMIIVKPTELCCFALSSDVVKGGLCAQNRGPNVSDLTSAERKSREQGLCLSCSVYPQCLEQWLLNG